MHSKRANIYQSCNVFLCASYLTPLFPLHINKVTLLLYYLLQALAGQHDGTWCHLATDGQIAMEIWCHSGMPSPFGTVAARVSRNALTAVQPLEENRPRFHLNKEDIILAYKYSQSPTSIALLPAFNLLSRSIQINPCLGRCLGQKGFIIHNLNSELP